MTQLRTAPEPTTRRPVPAPVLVALGLVAGVLAKAADESGWSWARDLGSFPAAWVLTVALLGRFAPSWRAAVIRTAVFFAAMSIAYYAWAAEVLDVGWNRPLLGSWLLLSFTAMPVTGLAAWWASRRSGVLPGALFAGPAAIALAGGVVRQQWDIWTGAQPYLMAQPVQAVVDIVVVLVLVVVLPQHLRTRLWSAALAVPFVWLIWALDLMRQVP
jgi:hypothetical protein